MVFMLKPTIFREYDIRGIAESELHDARHRTARPGLRHLLPAPFRQAITLGRDTRLSSPRLRDALLRGLKASGCHVTDLGVVPNAGALLFRLPPAGRRRRHDHRQP